MQFKPNRLVSPVTDRLTRYLAQFTPPIPEPRKQYRMVEYDNLNSGDEYKLGWRRQVWRIASRANVEVEASTRPTRASATLKNFIDKDLAEIIAIYGGDGTVHQLIDIAIYEYLRGNLTSLPIFALLGGGTQNALWKWLGWHQAPRYRWENLHRELRPHEVFARLLKGVPDSAIRTCAPMKIEYMEPPNSEHREARPRVRYGFMATFGCTSDMVDAYNQDKSKVKGLIMIGKGMTAAVTGWPPQYQTMLQQFDAEITVDGVRQPYNRPFALSLGSVDRWIYDLRPFAQAPTTETFCTRIDQLPPAAAALLMPFIGWGNVQLPDDVCFNQLTKEVTILSQLKIFQLDGEIYQVQPGTMIRITVGPTIRFVAAY